jgi:hypothetical protein
VGLDQPALQVVFNLVIITGVISLATFCYRLGRANNGAVPGSRLDGAKEEGLNEPPTTHQDIGEFVTRDFVAHHSQEWGIDFVARKSAGSDALAGTHKSPGAQESHSVE